METKRSFSGYILWFCVFLTIIVAWKIVDFLWSKDVTGYSLNEYLINYQGGFVRRGLIGELAFNSADPVHFISLLQKSLITFVLVGFILLLFFQQSNISRLIYTFSILFIPGGLLDFTSGNINEYLGRKEFWFYACLIIFFFITRYFANYPILAGTILGLISTFVILVHELFSIFILILFTVLFLVRNNFLNRRELVGAAMFYLPVLTTFYSVVTHHGDEKISSKILQSYSTKFPTLDVGSGNIQNITWSIQRSHEGTLAVINEGSILYYIFFAITAIVFILLFVIFKFRNTYHLRVAMMIFSANLTSSLLIFYFFWDVGRLISIFSLVTILSLVIADEKLNQLERLQRLRFKSSRITSDAFVANTAVALILLYLSAVSLPTRMEHCCSRPPAIPLFGIFGLT